MSARMGELLGERIPFVHATVVRAQAPSSARPGDDAVVLADGSIEGFVGGQCSEHSVRAAALEVLETGDPLLLRVLPDTEMGFPEAEGARVVVNPCLSGGALEIFLEPMLPNHLICVVGETSIADALAAMAETLGFGFNSVRTLASDNAEGALAVIVCSHGRDEPESIRAALDAGVPFIGLVASRRRGDAVLESMGLDKAARARVHTPVGLDIGARSAEEIALSIMAQVVRAVRCGEIAVDLLAPVPETAHYLDPVCGMTVVVGPDTPQLEIGGSPVYFCSPGCRDRYAA
jgi:xanthine dehydrogenase accessory factor